MRQNTDRGKLLLPFAVIQDYKTLTRWSSKRRDMSRHDLILAQTSNVCVIHLAALNAIATLYVCVKQFVMSLPVISLGDWISVSRKGGTGRWVGIYTPRG